VQHQFALGSHRGPYFTDEGHQEHIHIYSLQVAPVVDASRYAVV
jgi:hypothetical protein